MQNKQPALILYIGMLIESLQKDLKEALKAGDAFRVSTLRMVQSSLQMKAKDRRAAEVKKGGPAEDVALSDDEVIAVFRTEVKKRIDAAGEYEKGGRGELAAKEMKEVQIIKGYLPAEADDDTVRTAVQSAIEEVGKDQKMFGKIMGLAMKKLGNTASGDRVSATVKALLLK